MPFSPEKKREIILSHCENFSKRINFDEMREISNQLDTTIITCSSIKNCGDTLHLLLKIEKQYLYECFFSGEESCLITNVMAEMLCYYLEKKKVDFAKNIIKQCWLMIKGENENGYDLSDCPNIKIFEDVSKNPYRIDCISLAVETFEKALL